MFYMIALLLLLSVVSFVLYAFYLRLAAVVFKRPRPSWGVIFVVILVPAAFCLVSSCFSFTNVIIGAVLSVILQLIIGVAGWIIGVVLIKRALALKIIPSIAIYVGGVILSVILVKLFINPFLLAAYKVPTGAMERTILPGEWLMADKFTYGIHIPFSDAYVLPLSEPRPGQIMVFKSPYDGRTLAKRCVAKAGDTVAVRGKKLFINGVERTEPYVRHTDPHAMEIDYRLIDMAQFQKAWQAGQMAHSPFRDNFGPVVVPKGHLFMMGDNRDDSFDSRFWGPLPRNMIRGRPFLIYWSVDPEGSNIRWDRIGLKIQ
jgi:signal peptidase I